MLVESDGLSSVRINDFKRCSLFLLRKLEVALWLGSRAVGLAARWPGGTDSGCRAFQPEAYQCSSQVLSVWETDDDSRDIDGGCCGVPYWP